MHPEPSAEADSLAQLLAHKAWIERLAQQLVRDQHQAADLVQQTWLAALRSPPKKMGAPKAWLAAVLRNFIRMDQRQKQRQQIRQQSVLPPTELPSAEETLERVESQQFVVQAILELPHPYRDVVLLRYFHDLPPKTIAERLSQPLDSIKTRLRRAREKLRGKLNDEHPDQASWGILLLGGPRYGEVTASIATSSAASLSTLTFGGIIMSTKASAVTLIIAAVLACATPILWLQKNDLAGKLAALQQSSGNWQQQKSQLETEKQKLNSQLKQVSQERTDLENTLIQERSQKIAQPTTLAHSSAQTLGAGTPRLQLEDNLEDQMHNFGELGDIESLWLMAGELLRQGEPGYEQIISLMGQLNFRSPAMRDVMRNEEMLAGRFFQFASRNIENILKFSAYLTTYSESELPRELAGFRREVSDELGVLMLGYYDGPDNKLRDQYVDIFRGQLARGHRKSKDLLRALGQIRTDNSFDLLSEQLNLPDQRYIKSIVVSLGWQSDPRAIPLLEEFQQTQEDEAIVEFIDRALRRLRNSNQNR